MNWWCHTSSLKHINNILIKYKLRSKKYSEIFLTANWWSDEWCDALEEQQQPESIGQLLQAEQIDQYDGGQAHVGADGKTESGTISSERIKSGAERRDGSGYRRYTWIIIYIINSIICIFGLTNAAQCQTGIVHPQTVDPWLVRQVAEYYSAHCIGHTDYGNQVTGLCAVYVERFSLCDYVNVGHIEADAGKEVRQCKYHEDGIF